MAEQDDKEKYIEHLLVNVNLAYQMLRLGNQPLAEFVAINMLGFSSLEVSLSRETRNTLSAAGLALMLEHLEAKGNVGLTEAFKETMEKIQPGAEELVERIFSADDDKKLENMKKRLKAVPSF